MNKPNLEQVKGFVMKAGKFVAGVALMAAYAAVADNVSTKRTRLTTYTYSDAVNAIMGSDMWSSDKQEAVSILARGETTEFYKAVISIVNESSTWSSDKVKMIRGLSQ